jgi:hypothetical protein
MIMYVRTQQSSVTVRFFSNFYLLMQDDDGGTKNVFIATTAKFIVFSGFLTMRIQCFIIY